MRRLATVAVAGLLVGVGGCTQHPRAPAAPAHGSPSDTTPGSAGDAALNESFSWNGGSFRYPATWRVSHFDVVSSFTVLVAVLSNQPVHDPCTRSATTLTCGEPMSRLDPGGVLVTWTQVGMPGVGIDQQPGAETTVDGRQARVLVTTNGPGPGCANIAGTTAEVDAAILLDTNNHVWQLRACLAGPHSSTTQKTALAVFNSAHFDSATWNTSPVAAASRGSAKNPSTPSSAIVLTPGSDACAPTDYSQPPIPYGQATASQTRSPLLPASPDAVLVCRYAGTAESHPAGTLVSYARADTAQAVALAAALNASVPVDTAAPPPSCPTNSGAVYTETFSYGEQGATIATSSLNGCAMTSANSQAVWISTVALNILATLVGEQQPAASLILGPQPPGH